MRYFNDIWTQKKFYKEHHKLEISVEFLFKWIDNDNPRYTVTSIPKLPESITVTWQYCTRVIIKINIYSLGK